MGWQTDVITEVVFNKETYDSKYQIEDEISNNNEVIQNIVEELSIMTTARPEDLLLHNDNMDLLGLQRSVKDKLECLEECIIENYKLECLKENFDLRGGDFIHNTNRRHNIKQWLLKNYILEPEDLNMDIDDSEKEEL